MHLVENKKNIEELDERSLRVLDALRLQSSETLGFTAESVFEAECMRREGYEKSQSDWKQPVCLCSSRQNLLVAWANPNYGTLTADVIIVESEGKLEEDVFNILSTSDCEIMRW